MEEEKKLKVFLSSKMTGKINDTDIEYSELRKKVIEFINSEFNNEVEKVKIIEFKEKTPDSQDPEVVYLEGVAKSDVYLGFFGPEYSKGTIEEFLYDKCFNPYVFLMETNKENVFSEASDNSKKEKEDNSRLKEVREKLASIAYNKFNNKSKSIKYKSELKKEDLNEFMQNPKKSELGKGLKNIISEEIIVKFMLQEFPNFLKKDEIKLLYHPKAFIGGKNLQDCSNKNCKLVLISGPSGTGKTALLYQYLFEIKKSKPNIIFKDLFDKDKDLSDNVVLYRDNIQKDDFDYLISQIKKSIKNTYKIILTLRTDEDQSKNLIEKLSGELGKLNSIDLGSKDNIFTEKDIQLLTKTRRLTLKKWTILNLTPEQLSEIKKVTGGIVGDIVEILDYLIEKKRKAKDIEINKLIERGKGKLNEFRWGRLSDEEKEVLKQLSPFRDWIGERIFQSMIGSFESSYILDGGGKFKIYPDRFRDYIYNQLNENEKVNLHCQILEKYLDILNNNDLESLKLFDIYHYDELIKYDPNSAWNYIDFLKAVGMKLKDEAPFIAIEALKRYKEAVDKKKVQNIDYKAIWEFIELIRMYQNIEDAIKLSEEMLNKTISNKNQKVFCDFLAQHIRLKQRQSLIDAQNYIEKKEEKQYIEKCEDNPLVINHIARLYRDIGEFNKAKEYAEKALKAPHDSNNPEEKRRVAEIKYTYGSILVHLGKYELARENLEDSIVIRNEVKDYQGIPYCFYTIALSYLGEGELSEAKEKLNEAKEFIKEKQIRDSRIDFKIKTLELWLEFKEDKPREKIKKEIKKLRNEYYKYYEGKDGNELKLLKAFIYLEQNPSNVAIIETTTGILDTGSKFITMEYEIFKSKKLKKIKYQKKCDGKPIFSNLRFSPKNYKKLIKTNLGFYSLLLTPIISWAIYTFYQIKKADEQEEKPSQKISFELYNLLTYRKD